MFNKPLMAGYACRVGVAVLQPPHSDSSSECCPHGLGSYFFLSFMDSIARFRKHIQCDSFSGENISCAGKYFIVALAPCDSYGFVYMYQLIAVPVRQMFSPSYHPLYYPGTFP